MDSSTKNTKKLYRVFIIIFSKIIREFLYMHKIMLNQINHRQISLHMRPLPPLNRSTERSRRSPPPKRGLLFIPLLGGVRGGS